MDPNIKNLIPLFAKIIPSLNDEDVNKYTIKEFYESQKIKEKLLPGDIILTKTPKNLYSLVRSFLKIDYDHVVVLLDNDDVLHVSWPVIRKIKANLMLMKDSRPLILRPNLNKTQKTQFLWELKQSIGQKYDFIRLFHIFLKKFYLRDLKTKEFFKKSEKSKDFNEFLQRFDFTVPLPCKGNVCTDLITTLLCNCCEEFNNLVKENFDKLDASVLGSFMVDDLYRLAFFGNFFTVINPYENEKEVYKKQNDFYEILKFESNNEIKNKFETFKFFKRIVEVIGKFYRVYKYENVYRSIKNSLDKKYFLGKIRKNYLKIAAIMIAIKAILQKKESESSQKQLFKYLVDFLALSYQTFVYKNNLNNKKIKPKL